MKTLSVVIPSCGNSENLLRLVASISRQKIPSEAFEVLVVLNNHNKTEVPALTKELQHFVPDLQIVELEQKGVNRARNLGLEKAEGKLVYFIDDDCAFENPDLISEHIRLHADQAEVLAFGGGYKLPPSAGYFDRLYNLMQMQWFYGGFTGKKHNSYFETRQLLGGNFSIKKELSGAMRFEESISYGSSEYDYFIQANIKKQPLRAVEKDVVHFTNEKLFSVARKVFLQGLGKKVLDRKYQNQEAVSPAEEEMNIGLADKVFLRFYNYCYWYGYFYDESRAGKLLKLMFKDLFNYLNLLRYRILGKFQK